ncbi:MAG: hypothetical protein ACJAR1_002087 [Rubritalea sp.]
MSAIGGVNTTGLDFDLTNVLTDEIFAASESAVFSLAFTESARENSRLRGDTPEDVGRVRNNEINEIIHGFVDNKNVHWLDINQVRIEEKKYYTHCCGAIYLIISHLVIFISLSSCQTSEFALSKPLTPNNFHYVKAFKSQSTRYRSR